MKMKRAMLAWGIVALALIPVFKIVMAEEVSSASQFDVIAAAADDYQWKPGYCSS